MEFDWGQDLDIIQSGYHVIETGPRGITPLNTASVTRNGLVELPTGTTVKIGGDRVVIRAHDPQTALMWIAASTVLMPLAQALIDAYGWRETYRFYAGLGALLLIVAAGFTLLHNWLWPSGLLPASVEAMLYSGGVAVLPLLGLGLGAGMGADPVHVLTGTVVGSLCLAGGVGLAGAGVVWVDRIVATGGGRS